MDRSVGLMSLATATPPHAVLQTDAAEIARGLFAGRYEEFERLSSVFANTGIRSRCLARPLQWYLEPRGWPERTAAYLEAAEALFIEAASAALARAGLTGADVDTVVTVSSTGIATPSLEARVFSEMGFRRDVARVPVFGLGCAGGVSGLSLAARLARADPGTVVLFVTIELCTLAFRLDELTKANVVATALFGDGAAACVLRTGADAFAHVAGAAQHTWPGTLDIMGWTIDPAGFGVVLSRSLPRFLERRLAAPARRFVRDAKIDAPQFICHPGGAKVLDAVETALDLQKGTLRDEREVLRGHGNMSAPSVLFVLERALERGLRGQAVLAALGPGFTASFLALEGA